MHSKVRPGSPRNKPILAIIRRRECSCRCTALRKRSAEGALVTFMVTMSTNSNVIVAIILGGNVIVAVPHASSASAFVGRSASAFAWSATRRVAGFWQPRRPCTRHVAVGPRSLRRIVVGVLPSAALAFTSVRLRIPPRRTVLALFPIVDPLFEVLPGCLRCCHPRFFSFCMLRSPHLLA